jgi:hypothetical protein
LEQPETNNRFGKFISENDVESTESKITRKKHQLECENVQRMAIDPPAFLPQEIQYRSSKI